MATAIIVHADKKGWRMGGKGAKSSQAIAPTWATFNLGKKKNKKNFPGERGNLEKKGDGRGKREKTNTATHSYRDGR